MSFECFVCEMRKYGPPRLVADYNPYDERVFVGLNPRDMKFCDDCTEELFEWVNSRRK